MRYRSKQGIKIALSCLSQSIILLLSEVNALNATAYSTAQNLSLFIIASNEKAQLHKKAPLLQREPHHDHSFTHAVHTHKSQKAIDVKFFFA
jgi:hypothetical protein